MHYASCMAVMDEELSYEDRCQATLAWRLLYELRAAGVIGNYVFTQLNYPSNDQLVEAENGMK